MRAALIIIICTITLTFPSEITLSQVSSKTNLQSFFHELEKRPDTFHKIPINFKQNKFQLLEDLKTFQNDTIGNIRKYSYLIANNLTTNDSNSLLKQNVVNFLLNGYLDKNSGICGIVSDLLKSYPKDAYNYHAHQKIKNLLHSSPSYYHELIKLAGYINADSTDGILRELVSSGTLKNNEAYWATQLALARIGKQSAIEFCMNQIKSIKVDDDLIYNYVPDIIYIRQREAIEFLIQLLQSNEKNCESSNPESTNTIVCGYRIMEYLAPIIKDFPLKISESGDIDTNDYDKALQVCRDWFFQNPNYNILTEKY